ncbi:MAG: hypothetical protein ABSD68_03320 [Candidatus Micrarchaeales archaeon]|jgi:hypothetical protein
MHTKSSVLKPKKGETLEIVHLNGPTFTYETAKTVSLTAQLDKKRKVLMPILRVELRDGGVAQHSGVIKAQIISVKSEKQ